VTDYKARIDGRHLVGEITVILAKLHAECPAIIAARRAFVLPPTTDDDNDTSTSSTTRGLTFERSSPLPYSLAFKNKPKEEQE
jgi:hypothetical protein